MNKKDRDFHLNVIKEAQTVSEIIQYLYHLDTKIEYEARKKLTALGLSISNIMPVIGTR